MNKRKIISALLVIAILIACILLLFFRENHNKAVFPNVEYEKSEVVLIEQIPPELARKALYLQELERIEANATSRQEWFIQYKKLLEEYSDVADKPETIYDRYSSAELNLLFRVVQAEISHGYSFEQKANVASVIFNRLKDGRFGNSLGEVLNANQFSTISNGAIHRVTLEEKTILACEFVFMYGDTTGGALYFHSGEARSSFSGRTFKYNDGAHNFY